MDFNPRIDKNKKYNIGEEMKQEELNFGKSEEFSRTMIPGKFARAMRTCKIWQLFRFAVINIKMLVVVSKSH